MSAKRVVLAVLMTSLLGACGAKPTQAPLPGDGTYGVTPGAYDASGASASSDPNGLDAAPSGNTTSSAPAPAASVGPANYTFKGVVTDKASGNPIVGAKITIGSSTMVSGQDGSFEFDNIPDSKIFADVSQSGYNGLSHVEIDFSPASPSANKAFALAAGAGSSPSVGGTPGLGLQEKGAFGNPKFKSISAMAVSGGVVYVLGLVKGFLLTHNTIVAYDPSSGSEVFSTSKVGLISYLPKDATKLQATDSQVIASNGTNAYVFSADGKFVNKTAAIAVTPQTTVKDPAHKLTYTLKGGTTVTITPDGGSGTDYPLASVSNATQIAVDADGNLYALDAAGGAVHEYAFTPAN